MRKIYFFNKLSPNAYSLINLSLDEIFWALAQMETDPTKIWKQLNEAYGVDYFLQPVERQYGKRFARDYDALYTEIDKVKDEARYHITTLVTQTEYEIQNLRKTIDDKNQEIYSFQQSQVQELEKMKVEITLNMEGDFQTREIKCNFIFLILSVFLQLSKSLTLSWEICTRS